MASIFDAPFARLVPSLLRRLGVQAYFIPPAIPNDDYDPTAIDAASGGSSGDNPEEIEVYSSPPAPIAYKPGVNEKAQEADAYVVTTVPPELLAVYDSLPTYLFRFGTETFKVHATDKIMTGTNCPAFTIYLKK